VLSPAPPVPGCGLLGGVGVSSGSGFDELITVTLAPMTVNEMSSPVEPLGPPISPSKTRSLRPVATGTRVRRARIPDP
jgi:hypothetical protein